MTHPPPCPPGDRDPDARIPIPASLASVVDTVVRRTRLRRHERSEIAAELSAHFRDGLASGRSVDELVVAFGDPHSAARELRRGAIAKRSRFDRATRLALLAAGWGLAALVVVYLVATMHIATLRPVRSFDALAAYRDLLPETDAPAWPIYLESLAWIRSEATTGGPSDPLGSAERRDAFGEAIDKLLAGSHGFDEPVAFDRFGDAIEPFVPGEVLRGQTVQLDRLRDAATMGILGRDPTTALGQAIELEQAYFGTPALDLPEDDARGASSDMLLSVLLPQLSELRFASRLLLADSRLAEHDGDAARAARDLIAAFGVARHAEEDRTIIGQLVAASIRTRACRAIVAMLERDQIRFDAESLASLATAVNDVGPEALVLDLVAERLMFDDVMQRIYSDDGDGDGLFIPWAFSEFLPGVDGSAASVGGAASVAFAPIAYFAPSRRETADLYDRWMDANEEDSARPYWDRRHSLDAIQQEVMPDGAPSVLGGGNVVLALLVPALTKAGETLAEQRFDLDAAAIAIALARFRLERGGWPETVDQLVPEHLARVPIDPETTLPYAYAIRDGGPVVWSTGPDGIDDAGTPFREVRTSGVATDELAPLLRTPPAASRPPSIRTAVLLHRERTGRWPSSIDDLIAEDLAGVSEFAMADAAYRLDDGRPRIDRRTIDGASPFLRGRRPGEAAQGDRVIVEWGLGTFEPRSMAGHASTE